ncbi:MAG: DNA polymerase III subunit epsilon [Rhodospirillales bacterium]|nr:DNA polymerase III subunit epsilon [Rhodospirillales bacterium]
MTREIILDTETTGLDHSTGDRIVEIGCVELDHHRPTGRTFQRYLNPDRDMPAGAVAVHGLTREFLSRHPRFAQVVDDFLTFIGDAPLVIHNAEFDVGFINAELTRAGRPLILIERAVDTVTIARRRFPGAPASLDALCRRFAIDVSQRTLHGALKDADLLAKVYFELIGGREPTLALAAGIQVSLGPVATGPVRPKRPHAPTPAEIEAHTRFVDKLKNPIWRG